MRLPKLNLATTRKLQECWRVLFSGQKENQFFTIVFSINQPTDDAHFAKNKSFGFLMFERRSVPWQMKIVKRSYTHIRVCVQCDVLYIDLIEVCVSRISLTCILLF